MSGAKVELNPQRTKDVVLSKAPLFSPGILRVLDLLSKPDESATALAQAIAGDPALASQLLKLANSALFGAQARIDSVPKAVVAVGNSWVQHLTLTLGIHEYMKSAGQSPELDRCWRHMLASAVLSRELARALGLPADRAYAAGLLHDIGRLGLLAAFRRPYARAIEIASRDSTSLLEQERHVFGLDHAELGRSLVEAWNLPPEFGPVIGHHHARPAEGDARIETIVQLACSLADSLGYFFFPPSDPLTLEQARAILPSFARNRFPSHAEPLQSLVETAIEESALGSCSGFESIPAAEPPELEFASNSGGQRGWVGNALAALRRLW